MLQVTRIRFKTKGNVKEQKDKIRGRGIKKNMTINARQGTLTPFFWITFVV